MPRGQEIFSERTRGPSLRAEAPTIAARLADSRSSIPNAAIRSRRRRIRRACSASLEAAVPVAHSSQPGRPKRPSTRPTASSTARFRERYSGTPVRLDTAATAPGWRSPRSIRVFRSGAREPGVAGTARRGRALTRSARRRRAPRGPRPPRHPKVGVEARSARAREPPASGRIYITTVNPAQGSAVPSLPSPPCGPPAGIAKWNATCSGGQHPTTTSIRTEVPS